jgi:hypothetical protein
MDGDFILRSCLVLNKTMEYDRYISELVCDCLINAKAKMNLQPQVIT